MLILLLLGNEQNIHISKVRLDVSLDWKWISHGFSDVFSHC